MNTAVKDGIKKVSLVVERENGETTTFDGVGVIGAIITKDGDKDASVTAIAGSFSKSTLLYGIGTQLEAVADQLLKNGTPPRALHDLFHVMVDMAIDKAEEKSDTVSSEQKALLALAALLGKSGR